FSSFEFADRSAPVPQSGQLHERRRGNCPYLSPERERAVVLKRSGAVKVNSEQRAVSSWQSAVSSQQSAVGRIRSRIMRRCRSGPLTATACCRLPTADCPLATAHCPLLLARLARVVMIRPPWRIAVARLT